MKLDRVIAVRNNKTVFRDGNRCIKIFSSEFSKARVFAEALSHARAEACAPFVPKLIEVTCHEGKWAIVYEFAKGKTFSQYLEEEGEPDPDRVASFVDAQVKIHKTCGEGFADMKKAFCEAISSGPLDLSLKGELLQGLEKRRFAAFLCHGDFVPSNVIAGEKNKTFVIDWSMALSGEPLADAVITYLLSTVRGYESFAETYRKEYLGRVKKSEKAFWEWVPYCAAFLMKFVNQAEREALLPYVKTIENKGETK